MNRIDSIHALQLAQSRALKARDPNRLRVVVCGGTGCRANGAMQVAAALAKELKKRKQKARVEIKISGCHGFCQQGPVVVIEPDGIFYRAVGVVDLKRDTQDIVDAILLKGEPVERLLYTDPQGGEKFVRYHDIPFYAHQMRIALQNNGKIDPNDLGDYLAVGGYGALAKALTMDPNEIIDWLKRSGLRGRGGGGFPTGNKWAFCRQAEDRSLRYIICNADEGDPGAFMDRSIMEGDPHSVLEGMIIGAYAISRGICDARGQIYIRAEYPLAVANAKDAIAQAEKAGLLGESILGTDFSFHIKIKEGAGAFVCGEETALMASVEGRRGMPRPKPPFPANQGLFEKPTNINNVETWANVPRIVDKGPEWYAGIGTETSKGTKVFSLVGKVRNSGLVEVPMGTPLRKIVFDIGGGIPENKELKAIQTGGPSGGCIPARLQDMPVDYDALTRAGSIMGSGGMVVLDEDSCMVDIARFFVEFTRAESCGKCAPCRIGTVQLHSLLDRITAGKGTPEDIESLARLGSAIKATALCGLGQTAPNPVLTAIQYFREEYEEHVREKKCRAASCKALVRFIVDAEKCKKCGLCFKTCPSGAIWWERKQVAEIIQKKCIKCGACFDVCRFDSIVRK